MELVLTRIAKLKAYTIGRLSLPLTPSNWRGNSDAEKASLSGGNSDAEKASPSWGRMEGADTLEPTALELKTTVSKEAVLRSPTKVQKLKPFAIPEGRYAVVA